MQDFHSRETEATLRLLPEEGFSGGPHAQLVCQFYGPRPGYLLAKQSVRQVLIMANKLLALKGLGPIFNLAWACQFGRI